MPGVWIVKQVSVVAELTRIVAAAATDESVKDRVWVCWSPRLPTAAGASPVTRTRMRSLLPLQELNSARSNASETVLLDQRG